MNDFEGGQLFVSLDRSASGAWLKDIGDRLRGVDLNNDVCADAVVTDDTSGTVRIVLGGPDGLDASTAVAVDLPQATGERTVHARATDFHHDGLTQLVVAVTAFEWGEPVGTFVDVYTLDATGAVGTPSVVELPGTAIEDAPNAIVAGSGDVVLGFADEVVTKVRGAGAVHVFTPVATDPATLEETARLTQASAGIPGSPERNARFGMALALRDGRLAVGNPRATVNGAQRAGRVHLLEWNAQTRRFTMTRSLNQDTPAFPGTSETGDQFGSSVAFARGLTAAGSVDLVIGTPGETVGSASHAGAFSVASLSGARYRTFTQDSPGVPGKAETGDATGRAVDVLQQPSGADLLLVGSPDEEESCDGLVGAVTTTDGRPLATTAWHRIASPHCGDEDSDWFLGWGSDFSAGQHPRFYRWVS